MTTFQLPAVPGELHWNLEPVDWQVGPGDRLVISTGERSDLFNSPKGDFKSDNAPAALFTPPDASFLLSAKVTVHHQYDFDAGVLQVRAGPDLWGKLCFEFSPQRQPMIVSVVTHGLSDDCNSVDINGSEVYLRVAVTPNTVAFHYSLDGATWHFVRYFTLGKPDSLQVGFSSQAPRGPSCTAVFSEIRYQPGELSNNRSGE
jgi:uncharacterized protein